MAKKKASGRNRPPASPGATKGSATGPARKSPPAAGTKAPSQASSPNGLAQTTKPAATTPPVTKAAASKPPVTKAASSKPAASKPAASKTSVAKPTASKSTASKPAAKPASKGASPVSTPNRPRGGLTRAERLAAAEKARRRRAVQTRAAVAAGVALIVLVVGFLVVSNNQDRAKEAASFETGACDFDRKSDGDAGAGRNHVANPTYKVDPPAGGDHNATAAPAGTYTEANKPPDGQLVHSLEHGYVIIWHRPDLPPADLTALQELTQRHARDVLLVARSTLDQPIAATAWHARLLCGAPDVASLERFIDTYVNQGPEKIPH